jgi:hypothetical protein
MKIFKLNPSLKGLVEEMMGTPLKTFGTLWELQKFHTNALMQPDEQSTLSSCKHHFSFAKISSIGIFFLQVAREVS